jgi:hypothetical protein
LLVLGVEGVWDGQRAVERVHLPEDFASIDAMRAVPGVIRSDLELRREVAG